MDHGVGSAVAAAAGTSMIVAVGYAAILVAGLVALGNLTVRTARVPFRHREH